MYGNYIDTITSTLDEHAPLSRRLCSNKQYKSSFDGKALKLKILRRKSEKKFGIEVNMSNTKDNIYLQTNATRDTYINQKRNY